MRPVLQSCRVCTSEVLRTTNAFGGQASKSADELLICLQGVLFPSAALLGAPMVGRAFQNDGRPLPEHRGCQCSWPDGHVACVPGEAPDFCPELLIV